MSRSQASTATAGTTAGVDAAHTAFARLRSTDAHRQRVDFFVRHSTIDLGRGITGDSGARVTLGDNQGISRQHARIAWDAGSLAWHLTVQGKNGATVDGAQVTPGSAPVRLPSRAALAIGDRTLAWHGPAAGWPVLTGEGSVTVHEAGVE